jgi:hypothetical protein
MRILFCIYALVGAARAFVILPKVPQGTTVQLVLHAKGFSSRDTPSTTVEDQNRQKSIKSLEEWSKLVGIQSKDIKVSSGAPIIGGGLGLITTNSVQPNSVMLQVPTYLTFSVSNSKIESNRQSESYFLNNGKAYVDAPWWAKLSIDLFICDQINSKRSKSGNGEGDETIDMRPWLDSLPRSFDTPIRWSKSDLDELQYQPLVSMVVAQEKSYKATFNALKNAIDPSSPLVKWSYDDFLWGADCARSRAFSGAYSGNAFDPNPYALTLVLVVAYIGLHLGTMEQASNGAALVFCASVLRDFVLPKLFKAKKYVICPYIDMANHVGMKEEANVAFEYFANGYSLSSREGKALDKGTEVRISYGPRSNDALLQQYGFVETDNAHDVYVMPPLREWDIGAMEKACGRKFQAGRLQKLDRAGLLGGSSLGVNDDDDDFVEGVANRGRGVVLTRAAGLGEFCSFILHLFLSQMSLTLDTFFNTLQTQQ